MTTDLSSLLLYREVATRCRVTESCVRKWLTRGVKGPSGGRHYLNSTKVAGRCYIDPGDLETFLDALNGDA